MSLVPLVSVVVPVYNVEKYLNKCIDSLIRQTYQNKEIILVDDGSTDYCPQICDSYAEKNSFIRVIHKKNGGLSDARNVGIDIAKGDYLFFVDSDDYLHPQALEILIDVATQNKAGIVECGILSIDEKAHNPFCKEQKEITVLSYEHDSAIKNMLNYNFKVMAWNKLYLKSLFDGIRFPIGKLHEDEFTTPYVIDRCSKYCTVDTKLYAYVQRGHSIMNSEFNNRRLDIMEAQQQRINYFCKKYPGKYDYIIRYHYFVSCMELRAIMGDGYAGSVVEEKAKHLKLELLQGESQFKIKLKVVVYLLFPKLMAGRNKKKIGEV